MKVNTVQYCVNFR